jgi:hypothetical protein
MVVALTTYVSVVVYPGIVEVSVVATQASSVDPECVELVLELLEEELDEVE